MTMVNPLDMPPTRRRMTIATVPAEQEGLTTSEEFSFSVTKCSGRRAGRDSERQIRGVVEVRES